MYFYLSFLRPPPLQAHPSIPISITPQITNDLRTEFFQSEQDIFYSWSQCHPATMARTSPLKMTTWRQANAYKEIPVPLPPGIRDGQTWRLMLTASAHHSIPLHGTSTRLPFPAMSLPIQFTSKPVKGGKAKQEQIERIYALPITSQQVDASPPLLTVREHTAYDLDKKIWDSGIGLSAWIANLIKTSETESPGIVSEMKEALFAHDERNILELGAGTGIVALTLAALRSTLELTSGAIITTDLPSAMPLLQHNIASNTHLFTHTRPEAAVLDWDDPELPAQLTGHALDAIIMADVTYNTTSFPALIATLALLLRISPPSGSGPTGMLKPPLVLLGYKERDPAERTLWDMARGIGLEFERVGTHVGMGGQPVEIWIGLVQGADPRDAAGQS